MRNFTLKNPFMAVIALGGYFASTFEYRRKSQPMPKPSSFGRNTTLRVRQILNKRFDPVTMEQARMNRERRAKLKAQNIALTNEGKERAMRMIDLRANVMDALNRVK